VIFSIRVPLAVTRLRRLAADTLLLAAAFVAIVMPGLTQVRAMDSPASISVVVESLVFFAVLSVITLAVFRTYRMMWRYVSFKDVVAIVEAVTLINVVFWAGQILVINHGAHASAALLLVSVAVLWLANLCFLIAPRFLVRAISESRFFQFGKEKPQALVPALIMGDLDRIEAFIRETTRSAKPRYHIAGVLSDDNNLRGSVLHGVEVLGSIDKLPQILATLQRGQIRPHTLIVARHNASPEELKQLLAIAGAHDVKLGRLPPHGAFQDTQVRSIELADLLGRPEIVVENTAVSQMIKHKVVMITGAGGSIGGELSRQIARLEPSKLIVADFGEFNLYSIDKELSETFPLVPHETALVDVRDGDLVSQWIERTRPDIVFHAAALKHVPLLEDHPIEGVKTNVIGTVNVAEACRRHGVSAMVMISTDKAVNPSNVMGATKRLAEAYCQGLDQTDPNGTTRYVAVRFGNVLGSAGSVVPLFQRQIEAGGPVTITHPDITRYFMTIPEAVALVLQAGAEGVRNTKERGGIYVLEMGAPIRIIDLARQMIHLSGRRPDVDVKIDVVGLRPGEKLYEEVVHTGESVVPTHIKSVLKLVPRTSDLRIVRQQVQEFHQACSNSDVSRVLRLLKVSVPEYTPDRDAMSA
jgi:O-antigen biosynthesis protein WbqV